MFRDNVLLSFTCKFNTKFCVCKEKHVVYCFVNIKNLIIRSNPPHLHMKLARRFGNRTSFLQFARIIIGVALPAFASCGELV